MAEEIWMFTNIGNRRKYMVSSFGRVIGAQGKILKPRLINGYPIINYWSEGKIKSVLVHRLVAETFIPNLDDKPQVDHINTIRTDNRVENLRWVTCKENHNNPISLKRYKECNKGRKDSDKTRALKSIAHMGKNGCKGRKLTEEHKRRISESHSGEKCIWYGKKLTDEQRKRISENRRKSACPVLQFSHDGVFIAKYQSALIASEKLGICKRNIAHCAAGKAKMAGGFNWKYEHKNRMEE